MLLADLEVRVSAAMTAQQSVADQDAMAELWSHVFADFFQTVAVPAPLGSLRPVAIEAARLQARALLASSTLATGADVASKVVALFAAAVVSSSSPPATPPPAPWVPAGDSSGQAAAAHALANSLFQWASTGTVPGPLPWA